jgi:hypothetical protein
MQKLSPEEFTNLYSRYEEWFESQRGQKDGLVYEKSFVEFSRQMCAEIFERTNRASEDAGVREKKVITSYGSIVVLKENPLAVSLSTTGFRISPYLQELGCFIGQSLPFEEAS